MQSGTIVYKRVGDVNRRVWQEEIKPHLDALAKSAAAGPGNGVPHG